MQDIGHVSVSRLACFDLFLEILNEALCKVCFGGSLSSVVEIYWFLEWSRSVIFSGSFCSIVDTQMLCIS